MASLLRGLKENKAMTVQYQRGALRMNKCGVRGSASTVWSKRAALICFALCLAGVGNLALAATTVITTTSFDYDTATGLLKKSIVEPSDSNLCLVTEYAPDVYGHPQITTTRNCNGSPASASGALNEAAAPTGSAYFDPRSSRNDYSADQRFITKTTNALGQFEDKTYDARFGAIATLKGPNQLTTGWTYDGLGRKTLETRADGTQTKWDYVYCIYPSDPTWTWPGGAAGAPVGAATGTCETVPANFHQGSNLVGPSSIKPIYYVQSTPLKANGTANGVYSRVYFDSLGREIRTETQGFDGSGSGPLVYQDTSYERDGSVNVRTLPYTPDFAPYRIGYTRDVLGRTTQQYEGYAAGGAAATRTTYSGLSTTVKDPKGFNTTQVRNVAGQVATITDAKGGVLLQAYDPRGNLVQTTDAKGNVISMVYDIRGRKTDMYDPDMGVWNYVYNAASDLVQQTDGKRQVTTQSFDKLSRMYRRIEPDLTSNWYYDSYADPNVPCSKGIGKLCEATADNGYDRKHFYDSLGRPGSTTANINSQTFTAAIAYDPLTGRVSSQTYPTGLQVSSIYTPLGYPWKLIDARNGIALWTAQSRDAQGNLLQYQYGNNLVTTNTYFKDGRINTTQAGSSGSVQNLLYGYDLNRNIAARMDLDTGVTSSYGYDELNRLSSERRSGGALSGSQAIGWLYDTIGNMTSRSESGSTNTYNYNTSGLGSRRPHAVGSVSGSVNGAMAPIYYYDDNGNLTSGAGRTVGWTSANMVQAVAAGSTQLRFYYGPERDRVKETYTSNGAVQRTTVYLNPNAGAGLYYEEDSGVAGTRMKHYISAGGSTVAVIVCTTAPCTNIANTSTQYWHEDHLGSVSAITNESGAVVERMAYEPFGKRRNSNGVTDTNGTLTPSSTHRGYTEQEHMDEVGLVNMNGRIYDPGLGRFMSSDATVPHPNSTQSYNRYSYVRNNPLRSMDPSGFDDEPCDSCGGTSDTGDSSDSGGSTDTSSQYSVLPGDLSTLSTGLSGDPLTSPAGNAGAGSGDGLDIFSAIGQALDALRSSSAAGGDSSATVPCLTPCRVEVTGKSLLGEMRDAYQGRGCMTPTNACATERLGLATAYGKYLERTQALVNFDDLILMSLFPVGRLFMFERGAASVAAETAAADSGLLGKYLNGSGGRWGNSSTRLLNDSLATSLEDAGYQVTGGAGRAAEEWIPGLGGGTKGGTFVDLTATNGVSTVRVQTISTLMNGAPTTAEAAAAARIRAAFPNDQLILIPKWK